MKVIVTDAHTKHALAAIRSLGKENVDVIGISTYRINPGFYSKYCRKCYICNTPKNEEKFIQDIELIIRHNNYDVLLPIGFNSCVAVSKNIERLKDYIHIPIVNFDKMKIASDKNLTTSFAKKNGISVPKTYKPSSIEEISDISKKMRFPVVIKALEESGSVKYANTKNELMRIYRKECEKYNSQVKKGKYPQIQEYISGTGHGLYALFNHGKPRAFFMHKRLHEFPPTGGPSVMAQSYFDSDLKNLGLKILEDLKWHGVAMVEFKKDFQDNSYKLIEINPKFWGSLDLSITSGVNFPYLACKMCMDGDVEPVFDYKKDVIFRWVLPDFDYALATGRLGEYFINYFNRDIHDDLFIDDFFPNLIQFIKYPMDIKSKLKDRGNFGYPHGKPRRVS